MPATAPPKPGVRLYEKGDKIYLVGPATVYEPSEAQLTEFAFIENVKRMAPNPNLLWMHGQYVEADVANGNNALWKGKELAIASLTPTFMPVNVMHDPSVACGLIANADLLTPEKDGVPRARIETDLAVWKHLYPDVVDEAVLNARQGTLMQSMECFAPTYTCSDCGVGYMKLPNGAEEETWCAHLRGDGVERAARILERVVFTGVGLIFGTRGREGADPNAYLTMEEVAARHQEAHERAADRKITPKRDKTERERNRIIVADIEISPTEYAELNARPTKDDLQKVESEKASLDQRIKDLEGELETEKAAHTATKEELEAKKTELTDAETEKAAQELKSTRVSALGDKFLEALPPDTRTDLLNEQASKLTDEQWTKRVAELAALTKVDSTAKKDGGSVTPPPADAGTHSTTDIASLNVTPPADDSDGAPDQDTVLGGLAELV